MIQNLRFTTEICDEPNKYVLDLLANLRLIWLYAMAYNYANYYAFRKR